MYKLVLVTFFTLYALSVFSQDDFFVFRKGNKTIASFRKDSYIAFQADNRQWFSGYITKIHKDSFFIRPRVVHYNMMGTDTVYFDIQPFALADVYAMPKKGIQIDYINGQFQITTSGGHLHWYWIKSGWIFRYGAGGYMLLNLTNNLIDKDPPFARDNIGKLAAAAPVFLLGQLLHITYKPVVPLRGKYRLQPVRMTN